MTDLFLKRLLKVLLFTSIVILFVPVAVVTMTAIAMLEISKLYSLLVAKYEEPS